MAIVLASVTALAVRSYVATRDKKSVSSGSSDAVLAGYEPADVGVAKIIVRALGSGDTVTLSSDVRFNFRVADASTGSVVVKKYEMSPWFKINTLPLYLQRSLVGQKSKVSLRYLVPPKDAYEIVSFTGIDQKYTSYSLAYDTYVEARAGEPQ